MRYPVLSTQYPVPRTAPNAAVTTSSGETTPSCPLTSSIEETALATEALALAGPSTPLDRAAASLITQTDNATHFLPSPIGFYFAKLWYYEKLYPVIWSLGALKAARASSPRD